MKSTGAAFVDIPLTNMRRVIAQRLSESKQTIPHYYLNQDVQIDLLLKIRADLNAKAEGGLKLSVNDFVIKATAYACKKVPEANSSWCGDYIRQYTSVDVSVAVATDTGLTTPIISNADQLGLGAISTAMKDLASRAKNNKLKPHEYQGGTIAVSNLGMFGITNFTAIINPPQACILAVGGAQTRLVADPSSARGFTTQTFMTVSLSCDHRVVDGAVGARWMQAFREAIENPFVLLL